MTDFSLQTLLQENIKNHTPIEVDLASDSRQRVAYPLSITDEYLTLAGVNPDGRFVGVVIGRLTDIKLIKTDSIYLREFIAQHPGDSLYQQAVKAVDGVKEFTFEGFISAFEGTQTLVEIGNKEGDTWAGRVVAHDAKTLVLDEFYAEYDSRYARSLFNLEDIVGIGVDVPWLRTIGKSMAKKGL